MQKIDRKAASRLLKVSIRTVDRYINTKKLSVKKKDGRIWLNRSQILQFHNRANSRQTVDRSKIKMSIDKLVSTPVDMSIDNVHFVSTSRPPISAHVRDITGDITAPIAASKNTEIYTEIYKKLFEELQAELKIKQERLEGANYRVGQLEALLKDTIPRLDHQHALNAKKAAQEELSQRLENEQFNGQQLQTKLKEEKLDKIVYLIILFIIMLLQPLWLLLSLR